MGGVHVVKRGVRLVVPFFFERTRFGEFRFSAAVLGSIFLDFGGD